MRFSTILTAFFVTAAVAAPTPTLPEDPLSDLLGNIPGPVGDFASSVSSASHDFLSQAISIPREIAGNLLGLPYDIASDVWGALTPFARKAFVQNYAAKQHKEE